MTVHVSTVSLILLLLLLWISYSQPEQIVSTSQGLFVSSLNPGWLTVLPGTQHMLSLSIQIDAWTSAHPVPASSDTANGYQIRWYQIEERTRESRVQATFFISLHVLSWPPPYPGELLCASIMMQKLIGNGNSHLALRKWDLEHPSRNCLHARINGLLMSFPTDSIK